VLKDVYPRTRELENSSRNFKVEFEISFSYPTIDNIFFNRINTMIAINMITRFGGKRIP